MSAARILIIGATSAIAEATARAYATRGAQLYLLARDAQRAGAIAQDLRVRGDVEARSAALDVMDFAAHTGALDAAWQAFGGFDVVLIAHGTLPKQDACDADTELAMREFTLNATATIALANRTSRKFEAQGSGTLAVISSVAGDRGRASNYLYGAAKAAVSTYCSGLRQRLNAHDINVLTIKPGFVDTPMTAAFKKGPLWAHPDQVAAGIIKAIDRRHGVAYLPRFWWGIMLVIRSIPEFLFRRIRL
ncbi:MAG TPA: SDR family oxidoreductase [Rhodanobacteraceae bacterium]